MFCGYGSSYAGWQQGRKFDIPMGCGYFFDADNGLIGSGFFNSIAVMQIWWTNDGGKNWTQAKTPGNSLGRITSFFMVDRLVGYASVYSTDYSVWQTVDGGKSWSDFTNGNNYRATCIYKTSKAFIKTTWDSNPNRHLGGNSTDGGNTYNQIFRGGDGWSNGIDFCDDDIGVVVIGPKGNLPTTSWFTQDGGINWTKGGRLPESWSVYAVKGTKTFLTVSEDFGKTPGQTVYWSQDGGNNWQIRFTFPGSPKFTGHIGGRRQTLYAQTDTVANEGLYRSDDLGQSWKNVGGPSNSRDTRFSVTGCNGEVVYAFDDQGGVWKTTDGGDGTLFGSGNAALSFKQDSLYIETRYCQPINWIINLNNPGCNPLTLDAVTVTPNPYSEFSVDTNVSGIQLLASASSFGVPFTFHSDSNVTRHVLIHIKAHSGATIIDTTIILVAKHSTAPEPLLVTPAITKVGDTVLIPIFLRATQDSFIIRHYAVHLSYDGDVLTPSKGMSYQDIGTLSRNASIKIGNPEPNGVLCTVDFTTPITQASDLSLPLIYLRMGVTLSRNLFSAIRLDTFSILNLDPLPLCTIPTTEFIVDPQCGDSSLSSYMRNGKILNLLSVHPNPASGSIVEAEILLSQPAILDAELVDVMGKQAHPIFSKRSFQNGKHTLKIDTSLISSGTYILRMYAPEGEVIQHEIIIIR